MRKPRIGFIADGHLGNMRTLGGPVQSGLNRRGRQTVDALRRAREYCEGNDVDVLVSLGDLMHSVRPEPQLLAAAQQALGEMPSVLLLGNHEMVSAALGDNSLAPLGPVATLVEKDTVLEFEGVELWLVPYQPGPAHEWLPGSVASLAAGRDRHPDGARVLCLHLGISDKDTPYYLDGAPDSVSVQLLDEICRRFGVSHVVAGNWHRRKIWFSSEGTYAQVGALCPTGFSNPGLLGYGTVMVLDDGVLTVEEIAGPRFVKVEGLEALEELCTAPTYSGSLYVHAVVEPQDYATAIELLDENRSTGHFCDGKIDVVNVDIDTATNDAIKQVRKASDEQAVLLYVDAMGIPENVDPEEVKSRVREYLLP